MEKRDLSFAPRLEDVRQTRCIERAIEYDLQDIETHFNDSINSIKNNFGIANELISKGQYENAKDIYRSQVVFVVSALDYFMHEITKYGLYKIFKGEWDKTEKYNNFKVTMKEVENVINIPDSKHWFYEYVNNHYSKVVMIAPDDIKEQLNLVGIGYENVCKNFFSSKNPCDEFKIEFQKIYDRRNEIAHQNDCSHKNHSKNDIDESYINKVIDSIVKFAIIVINISKNK